MMDSAPLAEPLKQEQNAPSMSTSNGVDDLLGDLLSGGSQQQAQPVHQVVSLTTRNKYYDLHPFPSFHSHFLFIYLFFFMCESVHYIAFPYFYF